MWCTLPPVLAFIAICSQATVIATRQKRMVRSAVRPASGRDQQRQDEQVEQAGSCAGFRQVPISWQMPAGKSPAEGAEPASAGWVAVSQPISPPPSAVWASNFGLSGNPAGIQLEVSPESIPVIVQVENQQRQRPNPKARTAMARRRRGSVAKN